MTTSVAGPAPRPCESCPYRRDAPSGLWAAREYEKLLEYDHDTALQPTALFMCHQNSAGDDRARVCAGWVGCHGAELLALRLAGVLGEMTDSELRSALDYRSPVPLFTSGAAAAAHGMKDIENPDDAALAVMDKIRARRADIR